MAGKLCNSDAQREESGSSSSRHSFLRSTGCPFHCVDGLDRRKEPRRFHPDSEERQRDARSPARRRNNSGAHRIASAVETVPSASAVISSKCLRRSGREAGSTRPAKAIQALPKRRASSATPAAALPSRVCASRLPSPVMMRSDPAIASAKRPHVVTNSKNVRQRENQATPNRNKSCDA